MHGEKDLRVAIYIRLAREDEDKAQAQRNEMRDFAAQRGYTDCMEYMDNGVSGLATGRPAFLRLMADIQAKCVQLVMVRDVSCISRNCIVFYSWMDEMRRRGVGVEFKYVNGMLDLDRNIFV